MRFPTLFRLGAVGFAGAVLCAADFTPAPQRFRQEVTQRFTTTNGLPTADIQLLDLAADGRHRVFAGGRWSELRDGTWNPIDALTPKSEREFTLLDARGKPVTVQLPAKSVKQLVRTPKGVWLVTAADPYLVQDGRLVSQGWPSRWTVNQLAASPAGDVLVASSGGLFRRVGDGWAREEIFDGLGRAWAVNDVLGVAFDNAGRPWFATKAGVGCKTAQGWKFHEGKDGLPWNDFTGLAAGEGEDMWFATHLGAIRWDGRAFHYRQGQRWLPHDDVRAVAVDVANRAWFATAGGLGMLERKPMTLAEKAEFYEGEVQRYVKRTPFGYTAEAPLRTIADKSTAAPDDSDNDGLWTAMYGAGECFAYGATKDAKAKERATKAFEALRFLQKVTQGGPHAPPKGYIARTIRPVEWPDPNVGRIEGDREEAKRDGLWKVYEPRWPKSADGKWYWKSDTSSDELDGHFFFFPLYHDLVAETPAEKERVREVVRDLADHLLAHDFSLTDHDGKPTRWGVYSPGAMNGDPRWWAERGLNALSILSYLSAAGHVTGDAKYHAAVRELVAKHGYGQNLMFPKVQYGPGSGNHSDDEMAVMCFYNLLRYGQDPVLLNSVRYSFFAYWANEAPELNPFFNFAFAVHGRGQKITNVWGQFPVEPWAGWHDESMATLYGFPLDRLNWEHRNSHRLDVVRLPLQKSKDLYEPGNGGRGHRVNGQVLPVENRHFNHWNTDPWDLDYGGSGNVLGSGTVFLLPYYLGLYHGFIEKP
jgi:hypothetical protein